MSGKLIPKIHSEKLKFNQKRTLGENFETKAAMHASFWLGLKPAAESFRGVNQKMGQLSLSLSAF